ncbi:receptor-like protein kinase [Trifolium pratense]|uniref:Receptor-like protein kinase n=1 Tax=Trifolium pratense TaxID=57577 RepID=A0A2K3K826_TRIPR|nr:receptor-like protein kinase [Trifolium pratense]PNX74664.1 receptor-like protein kinase [Trifolium pratense]
MRNLSILIFHALLVLFSIVGFNSATENEKMMCKERERRALLKNENDESSIFLEALYMSMGIGFFTGFVGLVGSILLLPSWRETYSKFLNTLILKVLKWWKQ